MGSLREFCQWTLFRVPLVVDVYDTVLNDRLQVKLFNLDTPQLVQSSVNALTVINVGENEGDANEACALDISLAFSEKLTLRYLLVRTRRLSHSPRIVGLWVWWI
jgi:hypothetical protein